MRSRIGAFAMALSLVVWPLAGANGDPAGNRVSGGGHAGGRAVRAPLIGGGHFHGPNGTWASHPGWQGSVQFHQQWNGGHWWHGSYGGRTGSWWIVGPDWYWYPAEVAPVPDPYTPPGMIRGYWYWCDTYQQYYPYVGACPSGWQATQPL